MKNKLKIQRQTWMFTPPKPVLLFSQHQAVIYPECSVSHVATTTAEKNKALFECQEPFQHFSSSAIWVIKRVGARVIKFLLQFPPTCRGRTGGDEEPVNPFSSRASTCGQMHLFLTTTPLLSPPPFVKGQSLYSKEWQPPAACRRGRGGRPRYEESGRKTLFLPMQSQVGTHCCRAPVQSSVAQHTVV